MAALAQSIRRSAIGLGLFAIFTGGSIALTQALTHERIQAQAARAEARALFEIIPENRIDNDLLRDTVTLPAGAPLPTPGPVTGWVARRDGEPVGLILPVVAPDGYSGAIRLLVGLDPDGTVLGVRVTSHKETPGLGDRIETKKSNWVHAFEGRSLDNTERPRWNVKKDGGDFDQFTGATITPRAVVKAVARTLVYYRQHREEILRRLHVEERS
ncbi:electron transport complex subunit RsxG [Marinobacter lutaoensis]|jgi:electron transport complex protein RnfG|uniref:Ion-translocating oxidoreductase complex subunit G n=1 Tax=Marinobacter lutaoensis TaxID=135739 RepID=A0A1V2DPV6_9GAMM|nr:electron transport complex subunit RsxG [Marinobacter lutaoensis]MBI41996.1 electron transport complex subunit RsxG [Oceanospirillales bacterium]NVD36585.1 electron transport complex subunit RsxG [Marinobacter lutaoensis]ONF42421.1 electron transport complex subunit RsxG [Marinobacter lutaoensis]|tara:strand:+ start:14048 stop:14689 length:642 start_codon:yes stop_codon:yes gene_type:complete